MKECLKAILLAGATATAALALTGCVAPPHEHRVLVYDEPSWIIVERHHPIGYPVIHYDVYPPQGFHNPIGPRYVPVPRHVPSTPRHERHQK